MRKFIQFYFILFFFPSLTIICHAQTNGIVTTERIGSKGVVSFSPTSVVNGISDERHVDGYVKKYGTALFTFPVGNKGFYRPFAAEADGILGAYFKENPGSINITDLGSFPFDKKDSSIAKISPYEFWDVDGSNPSKLSFSWNSGSEIGNLTSNSLAKLGIVGWNSSSSRWEQIPSVVDVLGFVKGAESNLIEGSITTTHSFAPSTYSIYTLACLNTLTLPANYSGELETVTCGEIKGWIWDANHPDASVTVEFVENGLVHGSVSADIYRDDLNNIGSGKYGFSAPLPPSLKDGKSHQVSVRVRGTNFLLSGSPKAVNCVFGGELEEMDCYVMTGWAWDLANPDNAVTVELVEGTNVIASTVANIFREDLKNLNIGTGKYGFKIAVPSTIRDGKARAVFIRVKDTAYTITGSNKNLLCASPSYEGNFDLADCNTVKGWVWDRNNPASAVVLELFEGNTVHATLTANIYREDLKSIGTGNYGFSLPLPASLKDGKSHQISVRVKGTTVLLKNSPRTVSCAVLSAYEGKLEVASCTEVKGWAWDKNYPSTALVLELLEGSTVHATMTANTYREDLASLGTGAYGFNIALPASLKDGKSHQLSVRVKGSSTLLTGNLTVTCATPSLYEGSFDWADCNTIKGWIWDKNYPASAVVLELFEGNTVHATLTANIYREDLKSIGTGNYGFSLPLPASLKDGKSHQISVRVKGTTVLLKNSPRTVSCAMLSAYEGKLEVASCTEVKGWAWDKNYPSTALVLELLEGSTVHATMTANTYREDLASLGTGAYGFNIALPASLKDGKSHQLSVRVKGSSTLLTGNLTVTCATPSLYEGSFDWADCNTIKGWIWDKNYPASAVVLELFEGNTVHATLTANIYREDLKSIGTGNYGFSLPLPASLKDGKSHQISVRVKGTTVLLKNSPRTVSCAVLSAYEGKLEVASCTEVKGWAWDKNYPSTALVLELLEGSTVHATMTANTYREDLASLGTGAYGFNIALPASLKDGKSHQLSVRVKGSSTLLTGNLTVTCATPSLYEGSFDWADCNTIKGWIWDKNYPASAVVLELFEGNTVHATLTANIYREDLKSIGTGNYGFSLPLPASLKDGKSHQISVRVKGTTVLLKNSPRTVSCAMLSAYEGKLEVASCTEVKGWAWDKNYPSTALVLELLEGSTVHATMTANTYREDLASLGTGAYGFNIALPASLKDGKSHQLSVRVKGSSTLLTGNLTVTCATPSLYEGSFDWADCNTIKGWIWDKNYPASAVVLELFEGNTVHATLTANIYREDLKSIGTGNYGFSLPLPASLKDGKSHQISVRVKGTTVLLKNSPRTVSCAVLSAYEGKLEVASCTEVKGWAWDKNYPSTALVLELLEGSTVHATMTANTYREDLASLGTGAYGFNIALPASLKDGKSHQLSVRVKGSSTLLTGNLTVTCATPSLYEGSFDWADCNTIKGWIWDKNYPASAVVLELFEGNTVHATLTANIYREDLKSIGTGNYGFSLPLPASLKDGKSHQISVRVKGTTVLLKNSPRTVSCAIASRISVDLDLGFLEIDSQSSVSEAGFGLTIFPNPATDRLVIDYNVRKEEYTMTLTDLTGRVVWELIDVGNGRQAQLLLDVSKYVSGIYVFQLRTKEKSEAKRIVLAK